eukprot:16450362-Heterocapsa_arctica.AAC.1
MVMALPMATLSSLLGVGCLLLHCEPAPLRSSILHCDASLLSAAKWCQDEFTLLFVAATSMWERGFLISHESRA